MHFAQYYLDCLSQASYLVGDETTGRAVLVDPRRDVSEYVADAEAAGLTIELVIETHFHADFLSGHLETAAATGAQIGYSSVAETEFDSRALEHGERISLGEVELEIRHTPGHTPESLSVVIWERSGDEVPYGVLTGDTMFIGDVGRPDLLVSVGYTREELAATLFDSIHEQLLTLPDETKVFPGHGAGSACGKSLSTATSSTIGEQRATNRAILAGDRDAFVAMLTEGQPPAPKYFAYDAQRNRELRDLLDDDAPLAELSFDEVASAVAHGAVVVDARMPDAFVAGHLAGSVNVGIDGRFAETAGAVVPHDVDLVVVTDPGRELEARNRLARIGFDRVIGWTAPDAGAATADRLVAGTDRIPEGVVLLDVRGPGEVESGTLDDATTIPLQQLTDRLSELDPSEPTVVFCAGGYRSSVAASVLRSAGFDDVTELAGGYGAWSGPITV